MDLKAVGQRIKRAREAKGMTQEDLAAIINLSATHMSVIERGLKAARIDTFVGIANALDISADNLLLDVVTHASNNVAGELLLKINALPVDERKRVIRAMEAYLDD